MPTMLKLGFLISALLLGSAQGFTSPTRKVVRLPAVKGEETGWDSFKGTRSFVNIPSGEQQRQYRRTVYTHNDWKKHRSQDRFIYYLAAIFKSGVYKNIGREVFTITGVATLVCLYNAAVGGYTDINGLAQPALISSSLLPKLTLPLTAFTVTSSSLGLLLVFRTNTSYQRWDEARKNWGLNINRTRDLVRMANTYYDSTGISAEQRADDLNHVALCTWSFVRCMKRHLSPDEEDEDNFRKELKEKLPPLQAEMIIKAAHRPNRALQDLSYAIDDLPMHFMRKNEIHRDITQFEDNLGSSERLLTSPVPLFYSRHLARFLATWLLFLPFALYEPFGTSWNHITMIPATFVISIFLVGIEELGTQLEEPFTILPMQAFCDKIYNWCMEIVSWSPGDNGRAVRTPRADHAFFTTDSLMAEEYLYDEEGAPQPVEQLYSNPQPSQPAMPQDAQEPQEQSLSMADFLRQQGQGRNV